MLDAQVDAAASAPSTRRTTYEVTAIRYGSLRGRKSDFFHRYGSYGDPDVDAELAYFYWLLQSREGLILVDTGFDPAVGERRGRTCLVQPVDALGQLGISPADIRAVVVTHFHYDHIGNLAAFPAAELVVPRRELEFWTGPMAGHRQFAEHVEPSEIEVISRAAADGRVRVTDGVEQILPGIEAISVGGHSPGQQVTVVSTSGKPVVLASDAIHFYEELDRDRPFGVIADLEAMYRGYDRVRELGAEATVVPGHDPLVSTRFPPIDDGAAFAVRLDSG